MRYNIHGFSQPRAVELGLTNDDLLVLRWFVDFCNSGKMQKIEESGETFYWVRYQAVLDDLPILRIGKDRLFRKHFKTLCDVNVLKHKHVSVGGRFSYYSLGENYETLVYDQDSTHAVNLPYDTVKTPDDTVRKADDATKLPDDMAKVPEPYGKTTATHAVELPQPYGETTATKINLLDQSIINNSIIDSDTIPPLPPAGENEIPAINLQEKRFEQFWAVYPRKVGKGAARKAWMKLKPTAELFNKIMSAVEAAKKSKQWQKENGQYVPSPSTWLNQSRWEDDLGSLDSSRPTYNSDGWHMANEEDTHKLSAGFKMASEDDDWGAGK